VTGAAPGSSGAALRADPRLPPGVAGGAQTGLHPPVTGAGAGAREEARPRASYLVDDSGVFDVEPPCTEPVIRGGGPSG
jgi:hypothetical protein